MAVTQLQLVLSSGRREEEPRVYLPLLADETVASWAGRQSGVSLLSEGAPKETFGQLSIDLPLLPSSLRQQLHLAAQQPDEWMLQPRDRTLQCPRCVAEDWSRGVPAYDRRAWCVAWRTCCPRHGALFDTDQRSVPPGWMQLLESPRWSGQTLAIIPKQGGEVLLYLSLFSDLRAIYLEGALAGQPCEAWFPAGMTQTTLRETYREIVSDLTAMFLTQDGVEDQHLNAAFNRAKNNNRFAINVLAEAVLSEWTSTPLPMVLALRTSLLARAIGWGSRRPNRMRAGQVLLRGPIERTHSLVRYSKLLRQEDYARLEDPSDHSHFGYLTVPEAHLLGLFCDDTIAELAQMTVQGKFLAFNARRGCLVENCSLPVEARLVREQVSSRVVLPEWAFRSPTPQGQSEAADVMGHLFPQRSHDSKLRSDALGRRWRREQRKSVLYSPASRGDASDELLARLLLRWGSLTKQQKRELFAQMEATVEKLKT